MKTSSLSLPNVFFATILNLFFATILVAGPAAALPSEPPPGAVLTYHSDNFRTGWQQHETVLCATPTLLCPGVSGQFGLVKTFTLADQVDAQPLVIPHFSNGCASGTCSGNDIA